MEGLSLDLQHPYNMLDVAACLFNFSAGEEAETEGPLACQPNSLGRLQVNERPCLKS